MKNTLSIVLVSLLVSCSVSRKAADGNSGLDGKSSVSNIVESDKTNNKSISISKASIIKSMEYLASDELEGRATGTEGIEKAAVYIENFFKENNIKPYFETYRDTFKLRNIIGYNIVGVIEGNDPKLKNEFIILGGHYDHIGFGKEVGGDKIANGANDDASGTIAAMEFGKHFSKTKTNKRSILITLYAAEEMGLKGRTLKNVITGETMVWGDSIQLNDKGSLILTTKF